MASTIARAAYFDLSKINKDLLSTPEMFIIRKRYGFAYASVGRLPSQQPINPATAVSSAPLLRSAYNKIARQGHKPRRKIMVSRRVLRRRIAPKIVADGLTLILMLVSAFGASVCGDCRRLRP